MSRFSDIDLIMLDIDGTLINTPHNRKLPPETPQVLARVMDKGIRVGLASGRNYGHIMAHLGAMGLNGPLVCNNGAAVVIDGSVCYESTLDAPFLHYAYTLTQELECLAEFCSMDKLYIHCAPGYNGYVFAAAEDGASMVTLNGSLDDFHTAFINPVEKITFAVDSPQKADRLISALNKWNQHAVQPISITSSFWFAIEVTAQGVNKGQGLNIVLQKLNILPERVMAIGDGDNDVEMLKLAGISFAMENASAVAKAAAQYTAPNVAQNGACMVIRKYVLGDAEPTLSEG